MVFISIIGVSVFFLILSVWIGAVYVPSTNWAIEEMLDLAKVKKGEKAIDLGSGNGAVLIALARRGVEAHGYEINPVLVLWSMFLIWKAGLWGKAHAHVGSFFRADLSSYDVITIFVVPYIMRKVEKKVYAEAAKGTRVVVETFPFPTKKPLKKTKSVYLYSI